MNQDLLRLRTEIDDIDRRLVELVAERFGVVERVAAVKAANNIPARIPSRIAAVVERREAAGRGAGLPRGAAAQIWKTIVDETCKFEEGLIEELQRDNRL